MILAETIKRFTDLRIYCCVLMPLLFLDFCFKIYFWETDTVRNILMSL